MAYQESVKVANHTQRDGYNKPKKKESAGRGMASSGNRPVAYARLVLSTTAPSQTKLISASRALSIGTPFIEGWSGCR